MVPNKEDGLKAALQYFPNDFKYGFICIFNNLEDQELKQEVDQWSSDFLKLLSSRILRMFTVLKSIEVQ